MCCFPKVRNCFLFPNPDEAEVLRAVRLPSLKVVGLPSKCCSVAIASMQSLIYHYSCRKNYGSSRT